jgi:hypothetical protein
MKYARVFLKGEGTLRWVDAPLGTGTFVNFCVSVTMAGAVLPQEGWHAWVPLDQIKLIVEIDTALTGLPASSFIFEGGKPN